MNLPTVRLNMYKDKDIIDDQQKHKNRKSERIREIYRKGLQMEKLAEQGLTIVSIQHLQYLEQMVYGMQQQGQNVPVYPIQQPTQQPNPCNPPVYQPTVPVQPHPNPVQQPFQQPTQQQPTPESLQQSVEPESLKEDAQSVSEKAKDKTSLSDPVPQPPKTQETKQSPPPSPSINVEDDEDDEDDEFMSNLGSNFNF